jgi:hypothetical protein
MLLRRARPGERAGRSTAVSLAARLGLAVFLVAAPQPSAPIPRAPGQLARALADTTSALESAIRAWTPKASAAPNDVVLYALYQQRIYRNLARDRKLADGTLPLLAPPLRELSHDILAAHRELYRLTPPLPARAIKVGRAAPASTLLLDYREA